MSEASAENNPTEPPKPDQPVEASAPAASTPSFGPKFPRVMLTITVLVAAAIVLAFTFHSRLEDMTGVGLDIVMVVSFFSTLGVIALWFVWIVFLSRWSWKARLVAGGLTALLPVAFFKILRPVNGGDATIVRFDPIWNMRPEVAPVSDDATPDERIDLTTETPDDFPRFLGPDQDTVVRTGITIDPENFTDAKLLWKQEIGRGWSGFVARNGYCVTMEQRADQECVSCYKIETGELQWIYQHPARHLDTMNLGRIGPRSTPTIHDGRVYAVGAVGNFVCLDGGTGEVVWQQDLNELLNLELVTVTADDGLDVQYEKDSALVWGRSGSPLIVDDRVVIPGGGPLEGPNVTLLAFDQRTGELQWQGGDEMIAYGSPTLATVAGVEQILMTAETKAMSFDPETGDVLWTHDRPGETGGTANTSQVTVVTDSRVLTSKGYPDGGGELLEISNDNGQLSVTSIWKTEKSLKTKLTSPVIYDGHAYSMSNGFLECARLSDGKRVRKYGRFGHGQLLLVGSQLVAHSESGQLYLIEATPDKYIEYGRIPTVEGVCWNTLCLSGSRILVRSELEAACFDLLVIRTSAPDESMEQASR